MRAAARADGRRTHFSDRAVQGSVLLRIVAHWFVFLVVAAAFLLFVEMLSGDPREAVPGMLRRHGPSLLAVLVLAPIFIRDLCHLTNRFAGPMVRLRKAMRALADGRDVGRLEFRKGDFWPELATDFNRVLERVQAAPSAGASRTAEPRLPAGTPGEDTWNGTCSVHPSISTEQVPCHVPAERAGSHQFTPPSQSAQVKTVLRKEVRPRRGAAAVEFAVIAPLFLLLLAGIMEFGQAFRIQHSLSTAARHGARAAVLSGATSQQVTQKVQDHCARTLGISASDVSVALAVNGRSTSDISSASEASAISVTVSIPYSQAAVGFFANTFANSTLTSTCTFERE